MYYSSSPLPFLKGAVINNGRWYMHASCDVGPMYVDLSFKYRPQHIAGNVVLYVHTSVHTYKNDRIRYDLVFYFRLGGLLLKKK